MIPVSLTIPGLARCLADPEPVPAVAIGSVCHHAEVRTEVEFWPEYGGKGPLWSTDGRSLDLDSLGLSLALVARLRAWNARYEDASLPIDGGGDNQWLAEGRELLADVRTELSGSYEVTVHEDWWGEPGVPFRQPPSA